MRGGIGSFSGVVWGKVVMERVVRRYAIDDCLKEERLVPLRV